MQALDRLVTQAIAPYALTYADARARVLAACQPRPIASKHSVSRHIATTPDLARLRALERV